MEITKPAVVKKEKVVKVKPEKQIKEKKEKPTQPDKVNLNRPFVMTPARKVANDRLIIERGLLKQKLKEQREDMKVLAKAERAKTNVLLNEMKKQVMTPVRKPRIPKTPKTPVDTTPFIKFM